MPDVKPRPPEEMVGALHDRAHTDGKLIAATPVRGLRERTTMTPDLTALADELERLEKDSLSSEGACNRFMNRLRIEAPQLIEALRELGRVRAGVASMLRAGLTLDQALSSVMQLAGDAAMYGSQALDARARLRQAEGLLRESTDEINNRNDNDDACVVCGASWDNGEDHTEDCPVPRLHAFLASPPEPKEVGSE